MNDPLAPLRDRFLNRTRDDLATLRTLSPEADGAEMQRLAHRLAGTAGTFGYAEVSRLAAVVDDALYEGRAVSADALTELFAALEALS